MHPIRYYEAGAQVDMEYLGVTDKGLYFIGDKRITTVAIAGPYGTKSFRLPYSKILAIRAIEKGVNIEKNTVSSKPISFVSDADHQRFLHELISLTSKL